MTRRSSSLRPACRVTAASGLAPPAAASGGRTTPLLPIRRWTWLTRRYRAELGRRARGRSQRFQREHALPRYRRGKPLLVRLRGGRRHLQDDERRQHLDEAARRLRQQHDLLLRQLGRRLPRARHQQIVVDPTNPKHIFVGSALGDTRALARDRLARRRRSGLSRAQTQSASTSRPTAATTFTEVWNGNGAHLRRHRRRRSIRSIRRPSTRRRSTRASGVGRRPSTARASPTDFQQVFAPQFPGGGTDRTMFALTVKNGHDPDLPDSTAPPTEAAHRRRSRGTSGARTTPTRPQRPCSRRRRLDRRCRLAMETRSRRLTTAGSC